MNPLISIIIPVYNVDSYLIKCLDSCFNQSYTDIEVLAVNDGSTDKSGYILDDYAKKEPRLRVFHQENKGVVLARQTGIDNSQGDFIMFVDSDDYIKLYAIETLISLAIKTNADIVVGNYFEWKENTDKVKTYIFPSQQKTNKVDFLRLILDHKIQWALWAKLYKRELFRNTKLVPFKLGEDAALLVQLVNNSKIIVLTDELIYGYLQRVCSAVRTRSTKQVLDIYLFRRWIEDYLLENGYRDIKSIDFFVVSGYIECVFQGGIPYLSKQDYSDTLRRYNDVKFSLPIWKRLLFNVSQVPFLNILMVKSLRLLKKFNK